MVKYVIHQYINKINKKQNTKVKRIAFLLPIMILIIIIKRNTNKTNNQINEKTNKLCKLVSRHYFGLKCDWNSSVYTIIKFAL